MPVLLLRSNSMLQRACRRSLSLLRTIILRQGFNEAAIDYLLRAGQAEIARSATAEAITQLSKGLDLASALPDGVSRWERELELQIALGVALMTRLGWAAPEVGRANTRAHELCERLGDTTRLFPVLYGEWVFHVVRADLEMGRRAGEELLRLAQKQNDAAAETVGNRIVGTAEFFAANYRRRRGTWSELSLYTIARLTAPWRSCSRRIHASRDCRSYPGRCSPSATLRKPERKVMRLWPTPRSSATAIRLATLCFTAAYWHSSAAIGTKPGHEPTD